MARSKKEMDLRLQKANMMEWLKTRHSYITIRTETIPIDLDVTFVNDYFLNKLGEGVFNLNLNEIKAIHYATEFGGWNVIEYNDGTKLKIK